MTIRELTGADIPAVVPLYLEYYNGREGGCWTEETAGRRIGQVLRMDRGCGLLLEEEGRVLGFAMGYFKQYDDLLGYTLEEILIAASRQNQGLGSRLLAELEQRARQQGAALMELMSVNDEMHDRFYGKANYYKASNLIPRGKWLR